MYVCVIFEPQQCGIPTRDLDHLPTSQRQTGEALSQQAVSGFRWRRFNTCCVRAERRQTSRGPNIDRPRKLHKEVSGAQQRNENKTVLMSMAARRPYLARAQPCKLTERLERQRCRELDPGDRILEEQRNKKQPKTSGDGGWVRLPAWLTSNSRKVLCSRAVA